MTIFSEIDQMVNELNKVVGIVDKPISQEVKEIILRAQEERWAEIENALDETY